MRYGFAVFMLFFCFSLPDAFASILTKETSPSGISYTRIFDPTLEDTTITIVWRNNWAHSEDTNKHVPFLGRQILSHLGSEHFTQAQIQRHLELSGARVWLHQSNTDYVTHTITFRASGMNELFAMMHDQINHPHFTKARIQQGLRLAQKDFEERMLHSSTHDHETMLWALYGESHLAPSMTPYLFDHYDDISIEDLELWYRTTFTREPAHLVIAGFLSEEEAGSIVDRLLKQLPTGTEPIRRDIQTQTKKRTILLHDPSADEVRLLLFGPVSETQGNYLFMNYMISHALSHQGQPNLDPRVDYYERNEHLKGFWFQAFTTPILSKKPVFVMRATTFPDEEQDALAGLLAVYSEFLIAGPHDIFWEDWQKEEDDSDGPYPSLSHAGKEVFAQKLGALPGEGDDFKEWSANIDAFDMLKHMQQNYPKADELSIIITASNPDIWPGACVINHPKEAVHC